MKTLEEALKDSGGVIDRWILRLGKNEEEAGKFEPWALAANTQAEDFAGFLACLNLTRLVDSVTERMQVQKRGVRAAKKQQKAEQKEIAKMKAKVDAAAAKAQKKLDRAVEKERIKADAKKNREEAKRNAKEAKPSGDASANEKPVPNAGTFTESGQPNKRSGTCTEQTCPVVEVVAGSYEEAPVVHRPFVIPEEG